MISTPSSSYSSSIANEQAKDARQRDRVTLTVAEAAIMKGAAAEEATEDDLDAEVCTVRLFVPCTQEGVVEVDESA